MEVKISAGAGTVSVCNGCSSVCSCALRILWIGGFFTCYCSMLWCCARLLVSERVSSGVK